MSHAKPNTNVYWKKSKRLNKNIKQAGGVGLNLLPAKSRMCDLPEGLVVIGNRYEIIFRYVLNNYQHYQIGVSTCVRDDQNPDDYDHRHVWNYTGRLNSLKELKWFNRTVEELIPMALRLYS